MATCAEINGSNLVVRAIVVDDTIADPVAWCEQTLGGTWLLTTEDGSLRKHFAGPGYSYDAGRDAFIPPQPYASWVLNGTTCDWEAPVPLPDLVNTYVWDEATISWVLRG